MSNQATKKHVLLVTFPAYGHIIPILELGKKISKFHDVTLAVSAETVDQMKERELVSPEDNIQLFPIADGLSKNTILDPTDISSMGIIMSTALPAISKLIESLPGQGEKEDLGKGHLKIVDAVIADMFLLGAVTGCYEKKIPFYQFLTSNAGSLPMFLTIDESSPEIPLEGEIPMHEEPKPGDAKRPIPVMFKKIFLKNNAALPMVSGIIANTVAELEEDVMEVIKHHPKLGHIKLWTVGPLMPEEKENPTNSIQLGCISNWLDRKKPASVVYVSFGSAAYPSAEQISEIAKGLLALERPFIWSLKSSYHVHLPEKMRLIIGDQFRNPDSPFLLVDWAPQKAILAHSSTAVFLSHCGWNSSLESMWSGIPVVGWPMFAEQGINAEFLARKGMGIHIQGTGIKPKRIVPAEEITRSVKKVAGWNGEESSYWKVSQEWKTKIQRAESPGGSSYENLVDLIKFKN